MKEIQNKIKDALSGLKDFQLKTVDYVYEQLYKNNRNKMLIADEVGLGKTIVAKGLVAKAFSEFKPTSKNKTFDVIYVCSNQTLAKQNLKKLNFTGDYNVIDYSSDDDRLTSLAYESLKTDCKIPLRIKAFTPATSFDSKIHPGRANERVLLYRLLYRYKDIEPNKECLKWILKDNRRMSDANWDKYIKDAEEFDRRLEQNLQLDPNSWVRRKIRADVYYRFRKELAKEVKPENFPHLFKAAKLTYPVKYWSLIIRLCRSDVNRDNYHNYYFSKQLIGSLRFILSRICMEYLSADIFILDEFQRYKQLIENPKSEEEITPAIELARDIFTFSNSKILMLSATPFKPYTNDFDESNGEEHFKEFNSVLRFLLSEKNEDFWIDYEKDRREFFKILYNQVNSENKVKEAKVLKKKIENLYRNGMVRTERLLVSKDKDALIKQVSKNPLNIRDDDINDFIAFDHVTLLLNKKHKTSLPVPLEYIKSSPYSLSFLDGYQHKQKLKQYILEDEELFNLLQKTKNVWLDREDIRLYRPLIPAKGKSFPNAKIRLLIDETFKNDGWRYLWVPPSVPYYGFHGAFKNSNGFSKTLIFSSWKMVPRMIASVVSYEYERLSVGNPDSISEKEMVEEKRRYFDKPRSPKAQFTFKVDKSEGDNGEPGQMTSFGLLYPSLFLAKIYDPAKNISEKKKFPRVKNELKKTLEGLFKEKDLNKYVSKKGDWRKWYWLAPILLDKTGGHTELMKAWFNKGIPSSELAIIDSENGVNSPDESPGKKKHFDYAKYVFNIGTELISAGKLEGRNLNRVCEYLALLTLGSPSICYLRSQLRYKPQSVELLDSAFNVASAFLTMFNKPESIAVVRLNTANNEYYKRVIEYAVDGNIQAMLDEFLHLLINCENINSPTELSDFVSDILSIRTANLEFEDLSMFINNAEPQNKKKHLNLRSHYAMDFGRQKVMTASGAGRQINIRQAFNSPFHPFVLASTSIGQEGLDFHLYCKKIFHWNLPSNPIDFEQREGRIHRYQGLVIRLNLAEKYKNRVKFTSEANNVWQEIFRIASCEKKKGLCDLVPFWHTEPVHELKIERFVPLYPFSIDIDKFNTLLKILAFYRLTFGQPRQDELINALGEAGDYSKLKDLIINLSPILFYK